MKIKDMEWKSESDMQSELKKRLSEWKQGQSRDGHIIRAEGNFEYKGIIYTIKVLRYFNHNDKFTAMGSRISDCHCVVEFPEETQYLIDLVKDIDDNSEFLYHDTLHSFNDNQTIEQQMDLCHKWAKEDIDSIPSIIERAKDKIKRIEETILKLEKISANLTLLK